MNKRDRQLLLQLARKTLECYFSDTDVDVSAYSHITQLRGCFVTIHKHKALRGCIGFVKPIMPLYEQIITAARAAAFEDPRFPPLDKSEIGHIMIEISILTKPELLKNPETYIEQIIIGKDGLIIKGEKGEHSGLLLPQVATEQHFTPTIFLQEVCVKAGMQKDAWQDAVNKVYKFHAEVFSEDE